MIKLKHIAISAPLILAVAVNTAYAGDPNAGMEKAPTAVEQKTMDEKTMSGHNTMQESTTAGNYKTMDDAEEVAEEQKDASEILAESSTIVEKMKVDPDLKASLDKAKGVFLVPDFARAAVIVGGRGGQGVMLANDNSQWSSPAFYNFGSVSIGVQAGVTAGQVAMLLMTDEAVDQFKQDNNFSLNANADLTIATWEAVAEGKAGDADVVLWSDADGLFAGGSINVSDISYDKEANEAYYQQSASAEQIIDGEIESEQSNPLASVLD